MPSPVSLPEENPGSVPSSSEKAWMAEDAAPNAPASRSASSRFSSRTDCRRGDAGLVDLRREGREEFLAGHDKHFLSGIRS